MRFLRQKRRGDPRKPNRTFTENPVDKQPLPSRIISVTEFKGRCTEQLRDVEEQGVTLHITRHGKRVATVEPPKPEGPSMKEWIGSGAGLMKEGSAKLFDEPSSDPILLW